MNDFVQVGPFEITRWYLATGIILAVLMVGYLVFDVLRKRRQIRQFPVINARIEQEAMALGWTHKGERTNSSETHRFSGQSRGVSWQLKAEIPTESRRDPSSLFTRWSTNQISLPDEAIMISAKPINTIKPWRNSAANAKGNPLERIARRYTIKNLVNGDVDDVALFDHAQWIETGSAAFKGNYAVLATSEATASRFLNDDVQTALLAWAEKNERSTYARALTVVIWKHGIEILLVRTIFEPAELEGVIRVGVALASSQNAV